MCGSYFSDIVQIVLRILKLLAEEQATKSPRTTRLTSTIKPDWRTVEAQPLIRNGELGEKTKAILGLLKAFKRRTGAKVKVEEGVVTKTLRELKMEDAEIDQWEKLLIADSDVDL